MIRQNFNPIAKRSMQRCRCMFGRPLSHNGSKLLVQREQRPSFRLLVSSSVRVSSTTTTTTTMNASTGTRSNSNSNSNRLVASASGATATATAGSVQQIWQRTMPKLSEDAMRRALPIIGNGAYMALASGFLMTDMLQLRVMLVGGYAGLVAFHSLHARPLQIPLRWSALFVVVNAGAAMLLFVDQWIGVLLTDDEMALYERHFRDGLTPGQFYYLLKLAKTKEIEDGSMLTREGSASPNLYFIEKGQAKVYHRGTFAAYVDEGGFVNDVAFQQTEECNDSTDHDRIIRDGSGDSSSSRDEIGSSGAIHQNEKQQAPGVGAYGTVVANGDCKVLVWNQAELKEYLKQHPDMDRNMKYTLGQHLVRSLLRQREVRRRASPEEHDVLEKTELTMPERREFRRIKTSTWP